MDESRWTVGCGGRGKRNSFWPAGSAVNDSKEMSISRRRGKRPNKVNMEMRKTLGRYRNVVRRNVNVAVSLGCLTGEAGESPGGDITGQVRPNVT